MTKHFNIPDVIERFKIYHTSHGAWGSLHVVCDDLMSKTQRRKLASRS